MEERNWKQEMALGLALGSVIFLSTLLWGGPGFLASAAIILLLEVMLVLCLDKDSRFIALILLYLGLS